MKISSASKKVLASALSAAMVVAFAPTAAFGSIANGVNVTVTYDHNGGTIVDTQYKTIPNGSAVVADGKIELTDTYGALGAGKTVLKKGKSEFAFGFWFVDADGDKVWDEDEIKVTGDGSKGTIAAVDVAKLSGNTINLVASYSEPKMDADHSALTVNTSGSGSYGIDLIVTNLDSSEQYTAALVDGAGKTLVSTKAIDGAASVNFGTTGGLNSKLAAAVADKTVKFAKGDYKLVVTQIGADVVAEKAFSVVEVTLAAGNGYGTFQTGDVTKHLVVANAKADTTLTGLDTPTLSTAGGYAFTGYTANGTSCFGDSWTGRIAADTTLTAVYANPQVSNVEIDTYGTWANELYFEVENLPVLPATEQYNATVTGPAGFSKVIENIHTWDTYAPAADGTYVHTDADEYVDKGTHADAAQYITDNGLTDTETYAFASLAGSSYLDFDQKYEGYNQVTSKLAAGTYTITVAPVAKKDETLSAASKKISVQSKSATLAAVSYDLGTGAWKTDTDGTKTIENAVKALPTLWQVDTEISDIATIMGTVENYVKPASELESFVKFQIAGKDLTASNVNKKVAETGLTVTAVYAENKIAAPGVAFAADGTAYVMTVTPAAGTKVTFGTASSEPADEAAAAALATKAIPSDGKISLDPAKNAGDKYVVVMATDTANGKTSAPVVYVAATDSAKDVKATAETVMKTETVDSTVNKPVRYGDTLKTLNTDAEAAIKALNYAKVADMGKAVLAQEKAILDAVVAYEAEQLQAKTILTKAADGTYSIVTEAAAAAAVDSMKAAVADYVANVDGDATTKATDTTIDTVDKAVAAAKKAANLTTTKVAAADGDAAMPVVTAGKAVAKADAVTLATAKADKAAAEAFLAAYAELTTAQKQLVSSVDTENAQAVIKAADKVSTDTLKKATSKKTVKANSKKKVTAKLAKVSGVTYKKTSGSKKVTVSKTGKITVAKGLKKGKSYTVKAKATAGTKSKTVKITVKVAK